MRATRSRSRARLGVERQFSYKHAKYVMRIQLVDRVDNIKGGKGGYWED
jgi:DMSO/TMAO reductase YedYZ molybdopterin-dependent catalytic subunit